MISELRDQNANLEMKYRKKKEEFKQVRRELQEETVPKEVFDKQVQLVETENAAKRQVEERIHEVMAERENLKSNVADQSKEVFVLRGQVSNMQNEVERLVNDLH